MGCDGIGSNAVALRFSEPVSGAVAGLVCITPGRARGPMAAMVMGLAEERSVIFLVPSSKRGVV